MDKKITDMYNRISNTMLNLPTSEDDITILREELRAADLTGESEECLDRAAMMIEIMKDFLAKYEYCMRETIVGDLCFDEKTERFYVDSKEQTLTCGRSIEIFLVDRDDDERKCWHFGSVEGRQNKEAAEAGRSVNEYYFRCTHAGHPALEEGMRVRIRK